jgi:hypothetical protein
VNGSVAAAAAAAAALVAEQIKCTWWVDTTDDSLTSQLVLEALPVLLIVSG